MMFYISVTLQEIYSKEKNPFYCLYEEICPRSNRSLVCENRQSVPTERGEFFSPETLLKSQRFHQRAYFLRQKVSFVQNTYLERYKNTERNSKGRDFIIFMLDFKPTSSHGAKLSPRAFGQFETHSRKLSFKLRIRRL